MKTLWIFIILFTVISCAKKTPEFDVANYEQTLEFSEGFELEGKPARPMKEELATQWFEAIQAVSQFVPSTAVLENKVIFNNTLRAVQTGSDEKNSQLKKLNQEGVRLTSSAFSRCQRQSPEQTEEGEIYEGGLLKRGIQTQWSGSNCPLHFSDSLVSNIHFDKMQIEKATAHANLLSRVNNLRKYRKKVLDTEYSSNFIKNWEFDLNTRAYIEFVDEVYKKKSFVSTQGEGTMVLEDVQGQILKGTLKIETIMSGTWKETRLLFLGETPQGQLRWFIKSLNNNYFESSLNGEPLDNFELPYEIEQLMRQLY